MIIVIRPLSPVTVPCARREELERELKCATVKGSVAGFLRAVVASAVCSRLLLRLSRLCCFLALCG